jgi:hypothetical protein
MPDTMHLTTIDASAGFCKVLKTLFMPINSPKQAKTTKNRLKQPTKHIIGHMSGILKPKKTSAMPDTMHLTTIDASAGVFKVL